LTTSGDYGSDTVITADPIRLEQILLNLLNNAVRFTPNGGAVSLDVAVGTRDIRFSVSDTGPGIPVEEQDLIFEPFVRGKKVRERHEGSGLGLAVAKHLVQLHGGSITVESYPGRGTTFTVHLPQSLTREVLIPLRKSEGNRERTLSAAS
ncbi:MAG: ATP-binding protein, partial [Armatimonadetes bacterium]|nr:ATP-binding protein [Armatimonadota bacterium]